MSTYYKFVCKEHNTAGGFLTRQAWGHGNINIIETFKFLALHMNCRPYLVSEYDEDDGTSEDLWSNKEKFITDTHGMMPHSDDWRLVKDNEWKDVENIWEESLRKNELMK